MTSSGILQPVINVRYYTLILAKMESSCECGNEPKGSIKSWETIEWPHNLWPLEWYSVPQSNECQLLVSIDGLSYSFSSVEEITLTKKF
jgi:hypothetical protein